MTIEAGALALRISEIGAEQVEKKLADIDRKATALGSKTTTVKVTAPDLSLIDRQLEQMGKQVTLFKQGAQFAGTKAGALRELGAVERQLREIIGGSNTSLEQRIGAEKQLGQLLGARTGQTNSLTSALGRQLLVYLSFAAASRAYGAVSDAADRQETAQQKLSGTAKLTGQSLATVSAIAAGAQSRFKVSASVAADLTLAFVKLAARSGDVTQAGALMNSWMDLAKANGLSLDQILTGVNSTLMGQDEGLNRLGLQNPSNIYKAWADATGTTVAKMSEQDKMLAIVNAVTADGAKVQGAYADSLETTLGKQQSFNASLELALAAMGQNVSGTREWAYSVGTFFADAFVSADKFFNGVDQWFKRLDERMTPDWLERVLKATGIMSASKGTPLPEMTLTPTLSPEARAAQLALLGPKKPTAPTAAQIAAAKRDAEKIEKALGLDLGNVYPIGLTPSTPAARGPLVSPSVGLGSGGKMRGVPAFGMADVVDKELKALADKMKAKKDALKAIATDVALSIGDAFGDAFSSAFSGDEDFFAALGKSLLRSLGSILMSIGTSMIAYGALLTPLLGIPGPWTGLALGAAASAATGLGLTALGAAMGAAAGKGGGGGGGRGGKSGAGAWNAQKDDPNEFQVAFDPDRKLRGRAGSAVMPGARAVDSSPMPEAREQIVFNATIIGTDDPRAQRDIATMVRAAAQRGIRTA